MINVQNNNMEARKIAGYFTSASVLLVLVHYYAICYGVFRPEGSLIIRNIADRLYLVAERLPFIADDLKSKGLALLLLMIPSILLSRPADRKVGYTWPLIILGVGLYLYFSTVSLTPVNTEPSLAWRYTVITSIGYVMTVGAGARLSLALRYAFHRKRFRHDTSGFKQEERLITTEYSLNFPARYEYNGRMRKSYINIVNPRRGVLIMGSPGSGKTWFVIEPAIEQLTRKGRALFVYDYKFPALTDFTYNSFLRHSDKYPPSTHFYCINFTDLSRSHRCNVIDPATLQQINDALGISRTILLSMNRNWLSKQGEFFVESPINFLATLIWFLKVYKAGAFCTLPHVIELSKTPYDELFTILNVEPSTRGLVGPFKEAYLNKTMEMLDGQIASARIPLARLDSPDFYYVLSGNDLKLDINDPEAPAILCLGGDSARQESLAPVMSLYIDRLNRRINQPNRYPTALVLDEFATVRATSVLNTIATGRSNNIVPILAVQDLSQLTLQYSHDEAHQIMNTAGNLICGQIAGETARWVSERFHANAYLKTTVSVNSSDISTSKTEQAAETISPATLANLSSGEFVGVVADDPKVKLELKGFHSTFVKRPDRQPEKEPLPVVAQVDARTIEENYKRLSNEVEDLVKQEMKRILGDPELRKFIVKR